MLRKDSMQYTLRFVHTTKMLPMVNLDSTRVELAHVGFMEVGWFAFTLQKPYVGEL